MFSLSYARSYRFQRLRTGINLLRTDIWWLSHIVVNYKIATIRQTIKFSGTKTAQFTLKIFVFLFFFGLHVIWGKNTKFRRRPFFLVFIQFRRRYYIIFTEVLLHGKCVWSRLQKRPPPPPMQNVTI